MSKRAKPTAARPDRASRPAEAVRSAVEQALTATAGGAASARGRAGDLVEDIAGAAARVREALDDLRVLEDIKGLRAEVDALSERLAVLEGVEPPRRHSPVPRVPSRRVADPLAGSAPVTRPRPTARPESGRLR